MKIISGRKIAPGRARGLALVSPAPLSFFGGVDPETSIVVEKGHPIEGRSLAGRILVFPAGKGSTVGSYTLYRLKKNGRAPAAIVNRECETIVAVGAIIAEIPCVDRVDPAAIPDGAAVEVDGDRAEVRIED